MKKRADYILDKLSLGIVNGNRDNNASNKTKTIPQRGHQSLAKTSNTENDTKNTADDVNLSLADKEDIPDKENYLDIGNKSACSSSVIEDSPDRFVPHIDPKMLLPCNVNEINLHFESDENGQKVSPAKSSTSIRDILQNKTEIQQPNTVNSSSSSSSSDSSSSSSSSRSSSSERNSEPNPMNHNINEPSTSKAFRQDTPRRPTKKYHQSPINSDESDVDLSDSDPTYTVHNSNQRAPSRRVSSSSSSSSASSRSNPSTSKNNDDSVPETTRTSRKRKRNPSTWKQNLAKKMRNSGKAYVSSANKKEMPARSIKGACTCKLKCLENVNETDRQVLFERYWSIGNIELQRSYIRSCMMEIKPKYKYTNAERPRLPNNAFFFTVENKKVRVCKLFYINTLGICDRQIRTVKQKTDQSGFITPDSRGKHTSRKPTDPLLIEQIKQHIESIPRIESHFLRDQTSREYFDVGYDTSKACDEASKEFISGEKTIADLWRDFVKSQTNEGKSTCQYWLYNEIFNNDFNIGFFQPKKDRCNLCLQYELANVPLKLKLKHEYEDHINEKELSRYEKRADRQNINETNICAVYDLQAVLQCPTGETSAFFYKSKLNCLNFTIVQMLKKTDLMQEKRHKTKETEIGAYDNVYSYFWDEVQGKRGANEIGSCILDYLKRLNDQNPNKNLNVIFYSDNCCGQNKNKFIATLYSYAVSIFENIHTITHKYLIKGHTQNEGDNVHSLIEKEIKRNKKSGPIYTPCQYVTLIKNARKTGRPFHVMELTYDFFVDLKDLQENWGYNYNEDENRNSLLWTDIKVLKCCKTEPFIIEFKTSFSANKFNKLNIRNKRKKMLAPHEIPLNKAFSHRLELGEHKKKDLRDLIDKNLIPSYYVDFYKTIL